MYFLKRVYDYNPATDQPAFLLDRLWPRGVSKVKLTAIVWEKEITPSTALRQWLHQAPEQRFEEFSHLYRSELQQPPAQLVLQRLRAIEYQRHRVTLLSAVKDPAHSHLAVLRDVLESA